MLVVKLNALALMLLQEAPSFDLIHLWQQMGALAKGVVILLAIMSAWSIGVMIDRFLYFSSARRQSREFAPTVAGCLREGKIEEAIGVAEQNKRSHLAKVVEAGLQEFRVQGISQELSGEQIESSRRACERAEAIVNAEFRRGLSSLATIGATAPFVGLFGTTVGIINAFQGMSTSQSTGLGAVAGGISEALVTTAFGLFVAVPAVWAYNWFTNRVETFAIEMNNSSSELMDFFIKQKGK
ncbi:MAG TPA: MotA/TolQ/ExbB proton channel family protein [Terriglobia bacterium]|nr:MotA/TolQ/ExbB proton channel family protein [Terriglobia bacterium]